MEPLIIFATALLVAAAMPGPGIAAAVVGGLALTTDISWQWQLVLFAVLSLTAVGAARTYFRRGGDESDRPLLNKRALQHVGRSYPLEGGIENGRGKVRIGDTVWSVEGPDCPPGQRVKVTGADGAVLQVEPDEG